MNGRSFPSIAARCRWRSAGGQRAPRHAASAPGMRLESFEQDGRASCPHARRSDDTVVETRGDLLVGADGIHSAVRRLLTRAATAAVFRTHAVAGGHARPARSSPAARCSWPATRTRSSSPTRSPSRGAEGRSLINWIAELRVPRRTRRRRRTGTAGSTGRLRAGLRRLALRLARHPGADRRRRRASTSTRWWTATRCRAGPRAGHAARRRRAPDVPDRLQRRVPGDPRRAGLAERAGRAARDADAALARTRPSAGRATAAIVLRQPAQRARSR